MTDGSDATLVGLGSEYPELAPKKTVAREVNHQSLTHGLTRDGVVELILASKTQPDVTTWSDLIAGELLARQLEPAHLADDLAIDFLIECVEGEKGFINKIFNVAEARREAAERAKALKEEKRMKEEERIRKEYEEKKQIIEAKYQQNLSNLSSEPQSQATPAFQQDSRSAPVGSIVAHTLNSGESSIQPSTGLHLTVFELEADSRSNGLFGKPSTPNAPAFRNRANQPGSGTSLRFGARLTPLPQVPGFEASLTPPTPRFELPTHDFPPLPPSKAASVSEEVKRASANFGPPLPRPGAIQRFASQPAPQTTSSRTQTSPIPHYVGIGAFGHPVIQRTGPSDQVIKHVSLSGKPTQKFDGSKLNPMQQTGAFGSDPARPPRSAFGQPSQKPDVFCGPAAQTNLFGSESTRSRIFGEPSLSGNPFERPVANTNPFGQPTLPVNTQPGVSANHFAQLYPTANVFEQSTGSGKAGEVNIQSKNPFADLTTPSSSLDKPNLSETSSRNPFRKLNSSENIFARPSFSQNALGQPVSGNTSNEHPSLFNPFGQSTTSSANIFARHPSQAGNIFGQSSTANQTGRPSTAPPSSTSTGEYPYVPVLNPLFGISVGDTSTYEYDPLLDSTSEESDDKHDEES
ncbi:hypothetical protein TWF281_006539 [Arthrobotrys megalospora]